MDSERPIAPALILVLALITLSLWSYFSFEDAEDKLAQALDGGVVCVLVGEFFMGSDTGDDDERPQHRVFLDAFEIDQCEVTNVQYQRFLAHFSHLSN